MESLKMEVKIISRETMTPSSPTPSHLTNLTLSLLDQKFGPVIVPVLVFYGAPKGVQPLDVTHLKTCLSETLTTFYPLAGRYRTLNRGYYYETWGTLLCNDEGIPFVEAHVDCPISTVLGSTSSSNIDLLPLYPPKEDLIASGIHLAIQVNVFTCGGFAVGAYHTHKVTDGTSFSTLFRHWAALVTQRYDGAVLTPPDFNSGVIAFPPVPEKEKSETPKFDHTKQEDLNPQKKGGGREEELNPPKKEKKGAWTFELEKQKLRSFVFDTRALTELKAKAVSKQVPNPSRFEVVTGFLWKHLMLASPGEGSAVLNVAVDLRSRCNPPLPKGSMGNLVEHAHVLAEKKTQLPQVVTEIRGTISKMTGLIAEYQGENRAEAKERHWKEFLKRVIECNGKDNYLITSWCRSAGFIDVDFGFGKPKRIIPVDDVINLTQRNTIFLTEYTDSDGDGFEAWLYLTEKLMKYLESNHEFLAFASPSF